MGDPSPEWMGKPNSDKRPKTFLARLLLSLLVWIESTPFVWDIFLKIYIKFYYYYFFFEFVSFIFSACAACLSNRVVCCAFHLVGLCTLPLALVLRQAIK